MMKKVLFASKNLEIGGMEKALVSLLNKFDFNRYEVTLLLEEKKGVLLKKLNKNVKVEEYKLSKNNNVFFRKLVNFLHRFFWSLKNKNKYDFSCCYATYSRICNKLVRIASSNTLLYVHSNYYEYFRHNVSEVKSLFDELCISNFKNIAFVSNESKQGMAVVYPELSNRFLVINNIFDYKNIDILKNEKIKYKKNRKKTTFLFVGRMEDESKKLARLIKAVDLVKEETKDFELLVVGTGVDENYYKYIIKNYNLNNYIKMLGAKTNPYPYYCLADYVVLVSDFEGFPVIYNESMYLKKPVITTIDCSDEFINVGEDLAIVVEKDSYQIGDAMIKAINKEITKNLKKVDYESINNQRIEKIYNLISGGVE